MRNGAQRGRDALGDHDHVLHPVDVLEEDRELVAAERAIVSPGRTHVVRRPAPATSSSSPTAWPNESFTFLKSSRSRKSTADGCLPRGARATACATRLRKSARFARRVRSSWNAWCVSRDLERASLGDVARVDDDPADRRLPEQVRARVLRPHTCHPDAPAASPARPARPPRLVQREEEAARHRAVVGVHEVDQLRADEFLDVEAQHVPRGRTRVPDRRIGIDDEDHVRRVLDQGAEARLAARQDSTSSFTDATQPTSTRSTIATAMKAPMLSRFRRPRWSQEDDAATPMTSAGRFPRAARQDSRAGCPGGHVPGERRALSERGFQSTDRSSRLFRGCDGGRRAKCVGA